MCGIRGGCFSEWRVDIVFQRPVGFVSRKGEVVAGDLWLWYCGMRWVWIGGALEGLLFWERWCGHRVALFPGWGGKHLCGI